LQTLNVGAIARELLAVRELESLEYHVSRHGEYLGVSSPEEYMSYLVRHLQRTDLVHFVLARRKSDLMWYAAAVDTGVTAQYNVDRKKLWSFFRAPDLQRFIDLSGVVRIEQCFGEWKVLDE
jgi:hypothetical protein